MTYPIRAAALGFIAIALVGCNATRTMHDNNYQDMRDIYDDKTGHSAASAEGLLTLRAAVAPAACRDGDARVGHDASIRRYTRTAANELDFLFTRLPNPTIYLYVDPHLTGTEGIPVPGYTTAFPMYERDHWALPHEVPGRDGVAVPDGYKRGSMGAAR